MKTKKQSTTKKRKSSSRLAKSIRKLPKRNLKKAAIKRRIRKSLPLHKRLILHPLSVMVILCVGVFLISWTFRVIADTITITATVPAPPLTQGAVITSPVDGAVFTNSPIQVSGTCPDNSYINLYKNGSFSGAAWCAPDNTFSITTDLFVGQNTLNAQDYNITDSPGPITPSIQVTYTPPTSSSGSGSSTTPSQNKTTSSKKSVTLQPSNQPITQAPPLYLASDFHFKSFAVNQKYNWGLDVEGGTPPYTVLIIWGDGQSSKMILKTYPPFTISHAYKKAGYYSILVKVTDSKGNTSLMQLAALVRASKSPDVFTPGGIANSLSSGSSSSGISGNFLQAILNDSPAWLKFAWPSFIIVILMLFSFWLGERQEYHLLVPRKHQRSRTRHAL